MKLYVGRLLPREGQREGRKRRLGVDERLVTWRKGETMKGKGTEANERSLHGGNVDRTKMKG